MLQFRGSVVTSDAGLLAYRELDDALGLSTIAGETLADARTGKNGRHALVGLLRQSVFGRLAGYEDVNDAERLRHDPTMRPICFPSRRATAGSGPRSAAAVAESADAARDHRHLVDWVHPGQGGGDDGMPASFRPAGLGQLPVTIMDQYFQAQWAAADSGLE
jgi:hypothetical protein